MPHNGPLPDPRSWLPLPLILVGWLLASCERGNSPTGPRGLGSLPPKILIAGSARGTDGAGRSAECVFDFHIELRGEIRRTFERVDYRGIFGGGAGRTVLDADGDGFGFFADVAGEIEASLLIPNGFEFVAPAGVDSESRFWRQISRLAGTVDETGHGEGPWTCAPLDVDTGGYVDTAVTVTGAWRMSPVP